MHTRRALGLTFAVGLLLTAHVTLGQTAPRNLTFEVATIKPSLPLEKLAGDGKIVKMGNSVSASRAEYYFMSLRQLIASAYKMKEFQVTGPDWLVTERFDIMAKMPDGASKDDAPMMLRALLEERFKLAAHSVTQEGTVLALVVAKDGPKLKESPAVTEPIDENAPLKPGEKIIKSPDGPIRTTQNPDGSVTQNMGARGTITQRIDMQKQTITMESSRVTMAGFANMLTNMLQIGGGGGRKVVDMTGLKGYYQVAVELSIPAITAMSRAQGILPPPPPSAGGSDTSPAAEASDPGGGSTIYESVKKLGLRLEPRKAPVEQLVIDHIEKTPTEN
jgi:uncharacterized protein (TIGR03435 family)